MWTVLCRFQQATAYNAALPGDLVRVVNAHGSCVSPLNTSAASLQSINISAVAPEQWQNFTWASSSECLQHLPCSDDLSICRMLLWGRLSACSASHLDLVYGEGYMKAVVEICSQSYRLISILQTASRSMLFTA